MCCAGEAAKMPSEHSKEKSRYEAAATTKNALPYHRTVSVHNAKHSIAIKLNYLIAARSLHIDTSAYICYYL